MQSFAMYHIRQLYIALLTALFVIVAAGSAVSGEYQALRDVKQVKAVFQVSLGSPRSARQTFWAVKNVYEAEEVTSLPEKPEMVVVFHGPAVKLVSSSREDFSAEESADVDQFAEMIRQMKAEGVRFEVCLYAAEMLGVDPATILPEIDRVGNGFISVVGYQQQGYAVVRIP